MNKKFCALILSVLSLVPLNLLDASAPYSTKELYNRIVHDLRTVVDFTSLVRLAKKNPEVLTHRENNKTLFHHFLNAYCRTSLRPDRLEDMQDAFVQVT